jgi:hypothetical protein
MKKLEQSRNLNQTVMFNEAEEEPELWTGTN